MTTLAMLVIARTIPLATVGRSTSVTPETRPDTPFVADTPTATRSAWASGGSGPTCVSSESTASSICPAAGRAPSRPPTPVTRGGTTITTIPTRTRNDGQHGDQRGQETWHDPVEGVDDRPDHVGDQPADEERQQGGPRGHGQPEHEADHPGRQHDTRERGGVTVARRPRSRDHSRRARCSAGDRRGGAAVRAGADATVPSCRPSAARSSVSPCARGSDGRCRACRRRRRTSRDRPSARGRGARRCSRPRPRGRARGGPSHPGGRRPR